MTEEKTAAAEAEVVSVEAAQKKSAVTDFFGGVDLAQFDDSLEAFLKAGSHFGHQKARRHPRMMPYIFGVRGTVTIIDLEKTQKGMREAVEFLVSVRKSGKNILFVTTKRQMTDLVQSAAERADEPYVVGRWIGGTFSNFQQIRRRVRSLVRMEEEMEKGLFKKYTKLEQLRKKEEIEKLNRKMGGLKKMEDLPGAIVVVDVKTDALAVDEARKQGIPVVALTDTNVDPSLVDYVIPANDDAISSVKLVFGLMLKGLDGVVRPVMAAPKRDSRDGGRRGPRTRRAPRGEAKNDAPKA